MSCLRSACLFQNGYQKHFQTWNKLRLNSCQALIPFDIIDLLLKLLFKHGKKNELS